ncbi:MAG: hypothetical protein HYT13_02565 [Candidatus Liptonbacteria bacterium]|nr:hypothetical protein [Candidatus Liptonbacteria bacterium]
MKYKLMHPTEGRGWSREKVDRVEVLYKRFLFLAGSDSRPFMPTSEIDEMWHAHMLDTIKYREDCERIFGFFLDHFPYFGIRGEKDLFNMVRLFVECCQRYEAEYGEPYAEIPEDFWQIHGIREPIDYSAPEFLSLPERPRLEPIAV